MVSEIVSRLVNNPLFHENIASWNTEASRASSMVVIPDVIHPLLRQGLIEQNISSLYTHQYKSYFLSRAGFHIAITTGTASGKTLCYNLPVLDTLIGNQESNALYLFPTKALAQDQLLGINKLCKTIQSKAQKAESFHNLQAATYDGDTPGNARSNIRQTCRIIFTNPDMLHMGILPHHTRWIDFFKGLRYVIIDEMHTYRGVFGSHVANVLRRLKRIAGHYGSNFQYLLTSATIGNPKNLAENLTEQPIKIINTDGSPKGQKDFVIYNPPIIDPNLGLRENSFKETVRISRNLFEVGVQTIIFARTRRGVEILLRMLRDELQQVEHKNMIRAYRSGYLPKHRREIEKGLKNGAVRIVIATTALELGIDIGNLGCAVLVGYPGTISGTLQQAGRVGRSSEFSLAILVASMNPLDQFIAREPEYLLNQNPEQARINADNELILLDHIKCAAYELPFDENASFGRLKSNYLQEFLEYCSEEGLFYKSNCTYYWFSKEYPAGSVSLRTTSASGYSIQNIDNQPVEIIGEIDSDSAFWMVHPQAVYLHEGETYLVKDLDIENRNVNLTHKKVDYYTKPIQETEVDLKKIISQKSVVGGKIVYGELWITEQVTGFQKIKWDTHEKLGLERLTLPNTTLNTVGYLLLLDDKLVVSLREMGLWNNDPNYYGPDWDDLRSLVRARDGFFCQVCGVPEKDTAHHVHHKIPFRNYPSHQEANRMENLITLCSTCHSRVESGLRIRSGLAGLAYILQNLAPLYVMSETRDLGVHYDPQSSLNDCGPTIGLYDRIQGGLGFSKLLYKSHDRMMNRAFSIVTNCNCFDGCPSCVGPGGEFGSGSKRETLAILKKLIRD